MLRTTLAAAALVAGLTAPAAIQAHSQTPAPTIAKADTIKVTGDVTTALQITMADMKAMPRTKLTMEEDGRQVMYEGVAVSELLKKAGAPIGPALRGTAVATYILAGGSDGYEALFSIAELDPAFTANNVMIADSVDGKALFDYQGPFRLIAPKDQRAARSVRMLDRLQVVRLKK